MKHLHLILAVVLFTACKKDTAISENQRNGFTEIAQEYQRNYMKGGQNLDVILASIDKNIKMWENGKIWTFLDMKKFGPHLPTRKAIKIYNEQRLLEKDLGFDFVSLLYLNKEGDTVRETSSRIWRNSSNNWKIINMTNLLSDK